MGRASETQAPVTTHSTSSRLVPPLTGDLNSTIVEEVESPPITENKPIPAEPIDPAPGPEGTPLSTDGGPIIRLGSATPTSDSELTPLSDTDTS